jgi:hypothetical protein
VCVLSLKKFIAAVHNVCNSTVNLSVLLKELYAHFNNVYKLIEAIYTSVNKIENIRGGAEVTLIITIYN